jgi:4-amino-4-deoxy-L-arabinose transferase-like glycosyltransferase
MQQQGRRQRLWWAVALGLGLALRLWFLRHPMPGDDDTDVYAELAKNLFHHGVYGLHPEAPQASATILPTLIRLPGYPLFLALIFALFGEGNFHAVLLAQITFDLLGCWLIARFVREQVGERAATAAVFLAALCPFTASYSAMALTECLSVFAISLALWATGRLLRAQAAGRRDWTAIGWTSLGMGMAMLLRPDGVLLLVAVCGAIKLYAWQQGRLRQGVETVLVCALLAILPLAPWTLRNWRTFHVVQPLAPRRVNNPGEYVTYGFYRWMSTWSVDLVSTGNVFWRVGTEEISVSDLPSRAFDSPHQRAETAAILAEYNLRHTVTPALDAKFDTLANERRRDHPVLCRVWVPALRVADMFLRPRVETLGLDDDWWRFDRHRQESREAVALGALNLALMLAGIIGAVRVWKIHGRIRWLALPVLYVVLRCALLSTMENSEPRYTLEAFPFVLACAACAFNRPGNPGIAVEAVP